jgi:hypothetical protein
MLLECRALRNSCLVKNLGWLSSVNGSGQPRYHSPFCCDAMTSARLSKVSPRITSIEPSLIRALSERNADRRGQTQLADESLT